MKFTQFDDVLLEAKELTFSADGAGTGNANGNLLIGKAYTAMLDLESGDAFVHHKKCLPRRGSPWFQSALRSFKALPQRMT